MIVKRRRRVEPTDEEVQENDKKYIETIQKLNALEEEYKQIKSTLKCRYCGAPHYSDGYCNACYSRIKAGLPVKRINRRGDSRTNNMSRIFEKSLGSHIELLPYDFKEIVESSIIDNRSKDIMNLYFIENMTYKEIAEKYGFTVERARQIVSKAVWRCGFDWK